MSVFTKLWIKHCQGCGRKGKHFLVRDGVYLCNICNWNMELAETQKRKDAQCRPITVTAKTDWDLESIAELLEENGFITEEVAEVYCGPNPPEHIEVKANRDAVQRVLQEHLRDVNYPYDNFQII